MSDSVGFLISDVSRLMRREFDARARAIGVTRAQWKVLLALSRQEGANQGALAERLEVEPITLCRMIDRLEEAGHVERRRDPTDRRAWNIFLTNSARPLIDQLHRVANDLFDAAFAGLSGEERAALTAALGRVHANLSASDHKDQAAHG